MTIALTCIFRFTCIFITFFLFHALTIYVNIIYWHKKIFNIFIIISFKNQCVGANKCLRSWLQFRSLTSVALKNSQEKQLLLKSAAIQAYWLICWVTKTRLRYLIQVYMCLYQWSADKNIDFKTTSKVFIY